jgi:hypothetical protein
VILDRVLAYQRPFRRRVAGEGLVAVAPVSVAYVLAALVVSSLWRDPGAGHRLVAACCAWRAPDLARGDLAPLPGGALLVRRPVEAVWTVVAGWLLLGPLEAMVGGRRLLLLGAVGQVVPTVVVDLCWLAGGRTATGLAVDLATTPNLASVEHLVAAVVGVAGALILRPGLPRPAQPAGCRR